MSDGEKKKLSAKQVERILDFLVELEIRFLEQIDDDIPDESEHKVIDLSAYREAKRLISKAKELRNKPKNSTNRSEIDDSERNMSFNPESHNQ